MSTRTQTSGVTGCGGKQRLRALASQRAGPWAGSAFQEKLSEICERLIEVNWCLGWRGGGCPSISRLSSVLAQAMERGMIDLGEKEPDFLLNWTYKLRYFSLGSALLSCEHVDSITERHNVDQRDHLSQKL